MVEVLLEDPGLEIEFVSIITKVQEHGAASHTPPPPPLLHDNAPLSLALA